MSRTNKLELETFAGATIQAWKDQAAKAGLVLSTKDEGQDAGDFPEDRILVLGDLEET